MRGVMAYRSLYFYQHQIYLSCQYRLLKSIHYFEVIERMAFWPWGMQAEQQASLITVFVKRYVLHEVKIGN